MHPHPAPCKATLTKGGAGGRDGSVGGVAEDPLAVAALVETLLRQHGRVLMSAALVHLVVIACAGPALAALPHLADMAHGHGRFEPLATLAVAILVRLVEFGRRIGAEVRRRTRPAAHTKGKNPSLVVQRNARDGLTMVSLKIQR